MRERLTSRPERVCDRGSCGACTVLVDGKSAYACSILAIEMQAGDPPVASLAQAPCSIQCAGLLRPRRLDVRLLHTGLVMAAVARSRKPVADAAQAKAALDGTSACGTIHAARAVLNTKGVLWLRTRRFQKQRAGAAAPRTYPWPAEPTLVGKRIQRQDVRPGHRPGQFSSTSTVWGLHGRTFAHRTRTRASWLSTSPSHRSARREGRDGRVEPGASDVPG